MANAVGLFYVLNYASMHRNWKLAYFPMWKSVMNVVLCFVCLSGCE
jgi:hypothetical protein